MGIWERAFLYVRRKKRNSFLLFCFICLLSSLAMVGLVLRNMTDLAIVQAGKSLGGSFRIAPDMNNSGNVQVSQWNGQTSIRYIGEPLNEEVVKMVRNTQRIGAYNAVIKENVLFQGEIRLVDFNGKYQDDPLAMRLISVEADTNSECSADFEGKRLRLTDGEPITEGDRDAAVISKELAMRNHWRIGDEIQLSPCEGSTGQEVSVRIKGLFTVEEKQQNTDIAAPVNLLENRVFIDITSGRLLTDAAGADYIDFFVEDPEQVVPIIDEIRKNEEINWECFLVTADIREYEKIVNPLVNISILSNFLLAITAAMSIVVLSLVQALIHKGRKHEIGIMLSIGISKAEILLQHLIEMTAIAWGSFLLSFLFCFFGWCSIYRNVWYMELFGANGKLPMVPAVQTMASVWGYGTIVLFLSVLLSSVCLMRFEPKKILSKLS